MTAQRRRALLVAALGLTSILAGCVARDDRRIRAIPAQATAPRADRRVIILAFDGLDLSMFRNDEMPALHHLMADEAAAIGLMSRRSPGDHWQRHVSMWATLGAGRPAASGSPPASARLAQSEQRIIDMAPVRAANRRHYTLARPGALGEAVRQAGLTSAAMGSATSHSRWLTSFVAADYEGNVDCVEFGADLLRAFDRCAGANLVVIGHASRRAMDEKPGDLPATGRAVALYHVDRVAMDIFQRLRPHRDLLIVLSLTGPPYPRVMDRTMGPIIVVGAGGGLLTSRSTRREGIVTAADIAPTALGWLGVATPPEMSGRPMIVLPGRDASHRVAWLDRRTSATYAERLVMVPIVSAIEAVLVIITLVLWWPRRAESARRSRAARVGPLLGYALLVALLVLPWFGIRPMGQVIAIWLGLSIIITALAYRLGPLVGPAAVNAACAALIAADIAARADWMRYSVMSSDTIIGGRFYGIGNERAALFLGSLALAAGFAVQRRGWTTANRAAVGFAFAAAMALVGLPTLGANWGSAIVLTVGLGLCYARLGLPRVCGRHAAAVAVAAVLVAIALIILDRPWGTEQSHVGSAMRFLLSGDFGAAWATYARKMANNWALPDLSPLVIGVLAMIAAMLWVVIRPPGRLAVGLSRYSAVAAAVVGCLAAICVGMAVNDTGSVAAVVLSAMVMQTLVYLLLLPGESDASTGR